MAEGAGDLETPVEGAGGPTAQEQKPGLFELFLIAPFLVEPPPAAGGGAPLAAVDPAAAQEPLGVGALAAAPPRLLRFALPRQVELSEANADRPRTAAFALTDSRGDHAYGCAMTVVREEEGDRLDSSWALWGVVVLSCWPLVEVYKALLHSLYACRELYGLGAADGEPREPLVRFVRRARQQLLGFAAELRFVTEHPAWCGVTLQPLFAAVRWDAAKAAFLMLCLLSDQRVLLHSARRELLYPAAAALRSLIAPLTVAGIFVPYLPAGLLGAEETEALINEATQPYLIGCESSLVELLPRLNPDLVVLNLDSGSMKHPAALNGSFSRQALTGASAMRELSLQLQEGMGDGARFRPPEIRAACLGFVLGFCDPFGGAFAGGAPATARDGALAETLAAVGQLSADIAERFGRAADEAGRAELRQAASGAEAGLLPRLAGSVAKAAACEGDAAPLLEMVWSSMPFNVWWQSGHKADVVSHLLQHRSERRVLLEYMREHLRSLQLVEAKVEGALQETFASLASSS